MAVVDALSNSLNSGMISEDLDTGMPCFLKAFSRRISWAGFLYENRRQIATASGPDSIT